jgi:hypothetical protein
MLPVMTPEQREQALAKAAEARQAKTAALAELTAGKLTLAEVLSGEDPRLHRVKVHRILTALPGVGKVTADKALTVAGVAEGRRVKGLGDRQRKALAEHFAA